MIRTLATISTEKGIATIRHDDQTLELTANYADGSIEQIGDYSPTKSWDNARKQVIAWYGNTVAYHDPWVLCLRPVRALQISRSENCRTARGIARDTEEIRKYLIGCPAVKFVEVVGVDLLTFKFDPTKQPAAETIPTGVYFDLSEAPF